MDRTRLYVVLAVVLVAIASIVVLLFTGEAEPVPSFQDPSADVVVGEGANPPADTALADVRSAEVREEDGQIVFEAQLGAPIPNKLRDGAIGLRWEVYQGGDSTFLITANLDLGPNAYIVAEQGDFGGSTIDETFPGSLEVAGDRMAIRLDAGDVPDFPSEFAWLLKTSLDGDQGDAQSARAEDQAPDQGFGEYPADG